MATDALRSLVVSLEARIDKFEANMKSAADTTQKTMKGIESSLINAKTQFLGLAASVLSVGAAMKSIHDAVDLGDQLKTMSDATGIAVSKLDELSIIAKLNGAGLEDMAKGFKGLGKSIVESGDATSKQAKLFSALGIAVKDSAGNLRGVDEVMEDTAKALNSIENETTRAAVGTALFGKSYLQIAATLRNFKEDQQKANETLEQFGRVSQISANLADEFGDRLTLLGEGGKRALLDTLTPGLAAATTALEELTKNAGGATRAMGSLFSAIIEGTASAIVSTTAWLKITGESIGAYFAGLVTQSNAPAEEFARRMQIMRAEAERVKAAISTSAQFPGLDNSDQASRAAAAQDRLADAAARASVSSKKLADILGDSGKKANEAATFLKQLDAAMNSLEKSAAGSAAELQAFLSGAKELVPAEKALTEMMASDVWQKAPEVWRQLYEERARAIIQTQQLTRDTKEAVKADIDAFEAMNKLRKDFIANQTKVAASNKAVIDSLNLETSTMLLTNEERERAVELAKLQKQFDEGLIPTEEKLAEAQQALGDALTRRNTAAGLKKTLDEQAAAFKQTYDTISNTITDSIIRGFEGGKDWTKQFLEDLKRMFANLVLRPIIQATIAPLAGSIAGAISPSAAGAGIGGLGSSISGLSTAVNGLSSLFGSSSFTAGLAGDAFLPGALGASGLGSAGLAGLGASLTPIMAALPWAGLAAIAIPLIGKLFGGSKPPKEGGFGEAGVNVERFVSQSQFDATLAKSTAAMVTSFESLVKGLGGTITAGFAQGISGRQGKEKEGTTAAFVGGQEVFRSTAALGKDEASINTALQLESKRAILAALQASDIAARFAEILDSVSAATANSADVDRVLQLAQSLQLVETALGPLNANLGATGLAAAEAAQQLIDAAGGADQFASKVAAYNQTFLTENERLDAAFKSLSDSFSTIGVTMPKSISGFRDLVDSLDLTTEAGRNTWSALMDVAPAFAQVTTAVQGMISDIYSLQDSIHGVSGGDAALNQLNAAIANFVRAVPGFAPLLEQLGTQGFAANLANIMPSDLSNYTPSNIALIQSVLSAYNSLLQAGGGAQSGVVYPGQSGYPFETGGGTSSEPSGPSMEELMAKAQDEVDAMLRNFADLAARSTGDFGEKLSLQMRLAFGSLTNATSLQVPLLQKAASDFARQLGLFDSLRSRYSASTSEQLVKLSVYYEQQSAMLAGNVSGLDALNQVFEEQWNAIIAGTAEGVDGTIDQLKRLQKSILEYVDSLKLGSLSPLTAAQKLAEARSQYETTLAKANTGDQGALGSVTASADAFLKLARDFYASSPNYTDLFNRITGDLTSLGTKDFQLGEIPMNPADQALLEALPIGSTLMSALDFQNAAQFLTGTTTLAPSTPTEVQVDWQAHVGTNVPTPVVDPILVERLEAIAAAVYEAAVMLARVSSEDADGIKGEINQSKLAIVEAITVGTK